MEFHSMKRKALQALCKKHKIPANGTNLELADRLASLLKKPEAEPKSKKVRFSFEENDAEVIDLTKSEDRNEKPDFGKIKSSMKPGFEKINLQVNEIPARSTRSRKAAEVALHPPSPVQKRKRKREVEGENKEGPHITVLSSDPVGKTKTRRGKKADGVEKSAFVDSGQHGDDVSSGAVQIGVRVARSLRNREVVSNVVNTKNNDISPMKTRRGLKENRNNGEDVGKVAIPKTITKETSFRKRGKAQGDKAIISLIAEEGNALKRSTRNALMISKKNESVSKEKVKQPDNEIQHVTKETKIPKEPERAPRRSTRRLTIVASQTEEQVRTDLMVAENLIDESVPENAIPQGTGRPRRNTGNNKVSNLSSGQTMSKPGDLPRTSHRNSSKRKQEASTSAKGKHVRKIQVIVEEKSKRSKHRSSRRDSIPLDSEVAVSTEIILSKKALDEDTNRYDEKSALDNTNGINHEMNLNVADDLSKTADDVPQNVCLTDSVLPLLHTSCQETKEDSNDRGQTSADDKADVGESIGMCTESPIRSEGGSIPESNLKGPDFENLVSGTAVQVNARANTLSVHKNESTETEIRIHEFDVEASHQQDQIESSLDDACLAPNGSPYCYSTNDVIDGSLNCTKLSNSAQSKELLVGSFDFPVEEPIKKAILERVSKIQEEIVEMIPSSPKFDCESIDELLILKRQEVIKENTAQVSLGNSDNNMQQQKVDVLCHVSEKEEFEGNSSNKCGEGDFNEGRSVMLHESPVLPRKSITSEAHCHYGNSSNMNSTHVYQESSETKPLKEVQKELVRWRKEVVTDTHMFTDEATKDCIFESDSSVFEFSWGYNDVKTKDIIEEVDLSCLSEKSLVEVDQPCNSSCHVSVGGIKEPCEVERENAGSSPLGTSKSLWESGSSSQGDKEPKSRMAGHELGDVEINMFSGKNNINEGVSVRNSSFTETTEEIDTRESIPDDYNENSTLFSEKSPERLEDHAGDSILMAQASQNFSLEELKSTDNSLNQKVLLDVEGSVSTSQQCIEEVKEPMEESEEVANGFQGSVLCINEPCEFGKENPGSFALQSSETPPEKHSSNPGDTECNFDDYVTEAFSVMYQVSPLSVRKRSTSKAHCHYRSNSSRNITPIFQESSETKPLKQVQKEIVRLREEGVLKMDRMTRDMTEDYIFNSSNPFEENTKTGDVSEIEGEEQMLGTPCSLQELPPTGVNHIKMPENQNGLYFMGGTSSSERFDHKSVAEDNAELCKSMRSKPADFEVENELAVKPDSILEVSSGHTSIGTKEIIMEEVQDIEKPSEVEMENAGSSSLCSSKSLWENHSSSQGDKEPASSLIGYEFSAFEINMFSGHIIGDGDGVSFEKNASVDISVKKDACESLADDNTVDTIESSAAVETSEKIDACESLADDNADDNILLTEKCPEKLELHTVDGIGQALANYCYGLEEPKYTDNSMGQNEFLEVEESGCTVQNNTEEVNEPKNQMVENSSEAPQENETKSPDGSLFSGKSIDKDDHVGNVEGNVATSQQDLEDSFDQENYLIKNNEDGHCCSVSQKGDFPDKSCPEFKILKKSYLEALVGSSYSSKVVQEIRSKSPGIEARAGSIHQREDEISRNIPLEKATVSPSYGYDSSLKYKVINQGEIEFNEDVFRKDVSGKNYHSDYEGSEIWYSENEYSEYGYSDDEYCENEDRELKINLLSGNSADIDSATMIRDEFVPQDRPEDTSLSTSPGDLGKLGQQERHHVHIDEFPREGSPKTATASPSYATDIPLENEVVSQDIGDSGFSSLEISLGSENNAGNDNANMVKSEAVVDEISELSENNELQRKAVSTPDLHMTESTPKTIGKRDAMDVINSNLRKMHISSAAKGKRFNLLRTPMKRLSVANEMKENLPSMKLEQSGIGKSVMKRRALEDLQNTTDRRGNSTIH